MEPAMKMHVLSGGKLKVRAATYYPDETRDSMVVFPCSCILLRHAQGNVLFDSGCHPSVATDAAARWGGLAKSIVPAMAADDNVLAELGRIGLAPNDIDLVVNSHFHMDHCGCNAFFGRASFIVHAHEMEVARDPANEGKGYFRAEWDTGLPIETIDAEYDVFGDERIVLLPLPGHTPGSIGALATLENSGRFLLAADALSVRVSLERDHAPKNSWSGDLFRKSLDEIRRLERQGATVLCGHDPEQWQSLKKGAEAYD
jgi:glyoxylase-like metal-dependent hydrolase (beta-lactamase superfamily II)